MFPMSVPHADTVRLSLAKQEARRSYRDGVREDLKVGEMESAKGILWVYLDALSAFPQMGELLHKSPNEVSHGLLNEPGLSQAEIETMLMELDQDQIPVPIVTTYQESSSVAA